MKISLIDYKDFLINELNKTNTENLNKQFDLIRKHMHAIESLQNLKMLVDESFIQIDEEENSEEEEYKKLNENEFRFRKNLTGGIVECTDVRVNEAMCRELDLETGDIVIFENGEKDLKHLRFLRKAEEKAENDFVVFKYCEVKWDDPLLYCDESYYKGSSLIKIDEIPYKFVIPTFVIETLKIQHGDFIDIGYEKSNPYNLKVIWKYNEDEYIKPKTSSHYKDKNEKTVNEMFYGIDFNHSNVLIIGCEPRKRYYKEAIEQCNGKFIFLSGEEQLTRIESGIDNSDIVLILKDFLSHTVVQSAVSHSKEIGKSFKVVDGLGIKTIVFEARKLLVQEQMDM